MGHTIGIYWGFALSFIKWCLVSHDASVTEKCNNKRPNDARLNLKMLPKGAISYLWIPVACLHSKTSRVPPGFSIPSSKFHLRATTPRQQLAGIWLCRTLCRSWCDLTSPAQGRQVLCESGLAVSHTKGRETELHGPVIPLWLCVTWTGFFLCFWGLGVRNEKAGSIPKQGKLNFVTRFLVC